MTTEPQRRSCGERRARRSSRQQNPLSVPMFSHNPLHCAMPNQSHLALRCCSCSVFSCFSLGAMMAILLDLGKPGPIKTHPPGDIISTQHWSDFTPLPSERPKQTECAALILSVGGGGALETGRGQMEGTRPGLFCILIRPTDCTWHKMLKAHAAHCVCGGTAYFTVCFSLCELPNTLYCAGGSEPVSLFYRTSVRPEPRGREILIKEIRLFHQPVALERLVQMCEDE
ncbi:hypothetical protein JZ751_016721 [Albula glossodonta]|uniref:Uncharacterized protein n=1 Tax=Albula glossodonta TaxID=121402 RepID=A0A8T2NPR0_9TELE|nr:hypothetical protein JZ751_016721 [Albula glossodonta]